ncbi:hypothetical protein Nmel_005319 [Mimus melanotis]
MVTYPSDIKQCGVYWEATRDRDLTSMAWMKKMGLILRGGKNYFKSYVLDACSATHILEYSAHKNKIYDSSY